MTNRQQLIEEIFENLGAMRHRLFAGVALPGAQFTLSPSQLSVMLLVKGHGGIGIKQIASSLGVSPSAATQLVDSLVSRGFIKREESTMDRRAANISLSEECHKQMGAIRQKAMAKMLSAFEALDDAELSQYSLLTRKIASH